MKVILQVVIDQKMDTIFPVSEHSGSKADDLDKGASYYRIRADGTADKTLGAKCRCRAIPTFLPVSVLRFGGKGGNIVMKPSTPMAEHVVCRASESPHELGRRSPVTRNERKDTAEPRVNETPCTVVCLDFGYGSEWRELHDDALERRSNEVRSQERNASDIPSVAHRQTNHLLDFRYSSVLPLPPGPPMPPCDDSAAMMTSSFDIVSYHAQSQA
nr:hypothetical protein CFP56_10126 [Quercus suber]